MAKLPSLCALGLLFLTVTAYADTPYFYGGDLDPNNPNTDAILNENIGNQDPYTSATYQSFYAQSDITVRGLFANNLSDFLPVTGYWEIRSGISDGNGGTLVAAGTSASTNRLTGRSYHGLQEYTNLVGTGLGVSLPAGQYWFAVVLVRRCPGLSCLVTAASTTLTMAIPLA